MTQFEIKFYYDTICPWCYIGLRSLDRAIALYQKTYPGGSSDTFTFNWAPFYLDINASTKPMSQQDRIVQKNGEVIGRGAQTRLKRLGKVYGIDFTFQGMVGNSRLSHQLIRYAGTRGADVQRRVIELIFEKHFENTGDITSMDFLLGIGSNAGLDEVEVRQYLELGTGAKEVDEAAIVARADGIAHVPTFEINGVRIEGADESGDFYTALVSIKEDS